MIKNSVLRQNMTNLFNFSKFGFIFKSSNNLLSLSTLKNNSFYPIATNKFHSLENINQSFLQVQEFQQISTLNSISMMQNENMKIDEFSTISIDSNLNTNTNTLEDFPDTMPKVEFANKKTKQALRKRKRRKTGKSISLRIR